MKVVYILVCAFLLQACSNTPKKPPFKLTNIASYDQSVINILNKQIEKNIVITHWATIRKEDSFKCLSELGRGYELSLRYELAPNKLLARLQKPILFEPNKLKEIAKQGKQLIQNCGASSGNYRVNYTNNDGLSSNLSSDPYPLQARRDGMSATCEVTYLLGEDGLVKVIQNVDCGGVTRFFAKHAIMKAANFHASPEDVELGKARTSTVSFKLSASN